MTKYVDAGDIDLDAEEVYVDGVRLTEANADQIGRRIVEKHAEARRRRGRPPLRANETARARQVRLPQSLSDEVDQVAAEQSRKPSAVMRDAIAEYVNAHSKVS